MSEIQAAKQRAAELWIKMCQWDEVSPHNRFIVFTDTNPYKDEYDSAMSFIMSNQQGGGLCHVR